jgi:hypothetical protein
MDFLLASNILCKVERDMGHMRGYVVGGRYICSWDQMQIFPHDASGKRSTQQDMLLCN